MELKVLDGARFRDMLFCGARRLEQHKEHVDALNVFPVPDGDTGTNMSLTLMSAINEVKKMGTTEVGAFAEAAARGSLMGARGNSGVILSQLIRGMAKELKDKESISVDDFARALENGFRTASTAVMKPMEGTILTVAREAARAALKEAAKSKNFYYVFERLLLVANKTLEQTPEMLPVLKQAGVVDAGAMGWVLFLEGMYRGMTEESLEAEETFTAPAYPSKPVEAKATDLEALEGTIEFSYCTELLILGNSLDQELIQQKLMGLGDSLLVVGEDATVKVHIHSNHPGQVLETCLAFGALEGIKIENMVLQFEEQRKEAKKSGEPLKDFGFLAVSTGKGLEELFKSLGVDEVVSGGQTNNPSTQDLIEAIRLINAERIFILPNNGNVVMTARQAAKLVDKEVEVIPTKSIPAGIAAMVAFQPDKPWEVNLERMIQGAEATVAAEVTYAVRDTNVDGQEIKKDDIIGILDDRILSVGSDLAEITINLIEAIIDDDSEIVTLYAGTETGPDIVEKVMEQLEYKFPDLEVETHNGGQPLYYFLISVE